MLACVSGILVGSCYQNIDTNMNLIIGMKTFTAAVLGGVGSLPDAVVVGLIMGLAESANEKIGKQPKMCLTNHDLV